MIAFGVVGPGADELLPSVVERLADRGRVATVRNERDPAGPHRPPGAGASYAVDGEEWAATGEGMGLSGALDRLAPEFDYAVAVGFPSVGLPGVVLGDVDYEGSVLARASDASAVDLDALVSALEDCEPHVTLESLVARIKRAPDADRAGAIATFTGRVRARDTEDDAPTSYLEFEKYEGVAEERMATIREELTAREGVYEVLVHHRTGVVPDGEDIVFVVVLAGHREEAFETVSDGINRLKDEVPLFKKEVTAEETFWVHER